jgi:SET domain-containing protein
MVARYINDAKGLTRIKGLQNNTEFVKDKLRVYVEAIKDIKPGMELCVSYGKEYWAVIRQNNKVEAKKKVNG